jgi:hypothetical protein
MMNGIVLTIVQTKLPPRLQGRMTAVLTMIATVTLPVGFGVVTPYGPRLLNPLASGRSIGYRDPASPGSQPFGGTARNCEWWKRPEIGCMRVIQTVLNSRSWSRPTRRISRRWPACSSRTKPAPE